MARPKLTVCLDIISPFAYMAFYVTKNSPIFKQCDVNYVPVFLGGLMNSANNRPPIEIKNKGPYIFHQRERWATRFSIPFAASSPEPFPQLTLQVQRTLCAIMLTQPASTLNECFAALYHAFWVDLVSPINKPENFLPVLSRALGGGEAGSKLAKEMLEKGNSAEAKKVLVGNTEQAFQEGAFGLPWFVATDGEGKKEGFWGFDHLGQVVDHLGLERVGSGYRAML
ncbi:hypothetical protein KC327_g17000 [Hortaea werneckii]|uniref:Glutathione S-transferase kappa n=2 Tax=Hortaea werneckii TaxID=91943 RepID=A0A3M7I0Y5_HORWE|nr:hypothetical protein KC358_g17060 [Hortaea werneckii]OTA35715.1 hypothetical protein BTJ68_04992 [Hortaea werneckii EXF-2000]KAI6796084.1 hypothetical protein KC350_g16900 [Hortaea werneckii]KAI6899819.1 hypothetical protein KC348_g17027 [Hortaea werneckii]KAI6919891.1 hypothetical protein KC341_g16983 [Hortaea werneckii]